jgi:hypothetical protein
LNEPPGGVSIAYIHKRHHFWPLKWSISLLKSMAEPPWPIIWLWLGPYCNRFKGTDLGSLDPDTGLLTPFFNPRIQNWTNHFLLDGAEIVPLTPEGRVTVLILQFNHPGRLRERQHLIDAGQYDIT